MIRDVIREGRIDEASTLDVPETGGGDRAHPPAFPAELPAGLWERYQYVRLLGQGGMGRVFLAYEPRLRRNVALKFMRDQAPELTRRFLSEARAQARVDHERVCKVYEVDEVQGHVYIAMQHVAGRPLGELAGELTLTIEEKVTVVRDAAEGVHAAHRAGLIHRDIKPSNIMVERTESGALRTYVMDFGLARDWQEGVTATGTVLGTPEYMAPEQARGDVSRLDRRADVYSLGATLYRVLTGVAPIPGSNGLEVLNNIAIMEPRPLRAIDPGIPADLEAIALKCLEKDRSARYDSALALIEDLERFLDGEPIRARPAGLWYRLSKKARKHRALVAMAGAALVLVALALGWAAVERSTAAERARLAQRFTEQVEHIEALARYSSLSPLHDTRADREGIRARMAALEAEIAGAGDQGLGPGQYALGRGALALGDHATARGHLERAWQHGYREPRVAYALALVLGHDYQQALLAAEHIRDDEQRAARMRVIEERYRDPALAYLAQSQGRLAAPSAEYAAALIAYYEGRLGDALVRARAAGAALPWFYEAPKLEGDILLARGNQRWRRGQRTEADADLAQAREVYARAAAIGESDPEVHLAMAELAYAMARLALYGGSGDMAAPIQRGLEAAARAGQAAPDHAGARVTEARLYRRLAEHRTNNGGEVEAILRKAIAAAEAAIALAPGRADARLELGRCWRQWARNRQERGMDPRAQLQRAVEALDNVAPGELDYDVHSTRGLIYKTWADYEDQRGESSLAHRDQAIAAYQAAIAIDGGKAEAWINLGIAYFKRASRADGPDPDGDLERSKQALDRARSLQPAQMVPYFYTGQVYQQRARRRRSRGGDGRPDLEKALEMYRAGLEIRPKLTHFHNGAGNVLVELGADAWRGGQEPQPWFDQARSAFEQAVALAPGQGFAYSNIGDLHARRAMYLQAQGKDPGPSARAAEDALRQAIARIPDHAMPWSNLGWVYRILATGAVEDGRDPGAYLAQAMEALSQARSRNDELDQTWRELAEVRAVQARWQARHGAVAPADVEAIDNAFQKAVELAPDRLEHRIAWGHVFRWRAAHERAHGRDPGPALRQGLDMADAVLHVQSGDADALALRASLCQEMAEAVPPAEQRHWLVSAQRDYDTALAANRNLLPAWQAQRALVVQRLAALE